MQTLRKKLADIRGDLRDAERDLTYARALAEEAAIKKPDGAYAAARNAEERARALTLALGADEPYIAAATAEAMARDEMETLQAELDSLRDERRERQIRVLERICDLMESGTAGPILAAIGALG
jgi:hypothetical protein